MTWSYWTTALEWLTGGIILGYILRDMRDALALATRRNGGPMAVTNPAPGRPVTSRAIVQIRIVGALILVAVIVSIVLDAVNASRQLGQAHRLNNLSACEARVDEQFIVAIKGRATYSDEAQGALVTLISSIPTVFTAPATFRTTFAQHLRTYDATITRLDAERPKLPPLPSQVCS